MYQTFPFEFPQLFFPSSWRCMRSAIASLFQWVAIIFIWLVDSRSPNWPFGQAAIATDARSLPTSPTFFGVTVNFATDRSVEHIILFPHHCCMWSVFYYSGSTGFGNCLVVKLHRWKYGRLNFSNSCDVKTCQLFFKEKVLLNIHHRLSLDDMVTTEVSAGLNIPHQFFP